MYIECRVAIHSSLTMLSAPDRDFLSLLSEAAFANPFGEDRTRIDRTLAGAPKREEEPAVLARLLSRVRERIAGLPDADVRRYAGAERALVEQAILFDAFHRVAGDFDAFILEQIDAPPKRGKTGVVPFGRETIAWLVAAGFDEGEASRYFSLFYQLRRAFHFIARTLPGSVPSMRRLRERLWANVFTHDPRFYARYLWRKMEDFSTILLGGTGTGKGIAAAAIGRSGWIPYDAGRGVFIESFVDSFLSINLSQFSGALIESELFGHKKGAFTGAIEGHAGVLARCTRHGAIFLDEIGEIGVPLQIKLLRVLQEREYSPVGGHEVERFSGRVIAATNRPLDDLRARGEFRDDFYYRLCSDVIEVPSLAVRLQEDPREIDVLLTVILRRIVGDDAAEAHALVRTAIDRDLGPDYAWPGNVRELEQCARRVLLTRRCTDDVNRKAHDLRSADDAALLEAAGEETVKGLVTRYCRALYARHPSYEEVARRTGLDRRTVKAHVT